MLTFYKKQGRHELPWRKTSDAYKILVSEVMLQQTQVDRVIGYYDRFLKRFPTLQALAAAPLADVLKLWQGLGYNRRAKMLHEAAKKAVEQYGGKLPGTIEELESLPGVGHYTARAVAAFAFNTDSVFVETNIRTTVIHHFYPRKKEVSDAQIMMLLQAARSKARGKISAREWNWALMDYGSYLKRAGVRVHRRAKAYAKQPAFEGSNRQARGAILRALARGPIREPALAQLLGSARADQLRTALKRLADEGMVRASRGSYSLPG